jgi:hypothetical protein
VKSEPKPKYEYIHLYVEWTDLTELNRYASDGWRVAAVIPHRVMPGMFALLERQVL